MSAPTPLPMPFPERESSGKRRRLPHFMNGIGLCFAIGLFAAGCFDGSRAAREVSMTELEMKENGRYYLKGSYESFSGIGYHEKNGKRISQSEFVEGFREGDHIVFWPESGLRRSSGPYREGFRHALHINWNEEGEKLSESSYSDGVLEGPHRAWYPASGAIKEEGDYSAGKRHGQWVTYFDDVDLAYQAPEKRRRFEEITYEKGLLHGTKRNWTLNGQLVYEGEFGNGQMTSRHVAWYPTGVKKESIFYRQGQVSGKQQEWHPNGKLKYETLIGPGGSPGKERFWDANGNAMEYHPDDEPPDPPEEEPVEGEEFPGSEDETDSNPPRVA